MEFIVDLLSRIPASFWGVIVGSAFSLAAVFVTNWYNDRRQEQQFEHERQSRNTDRAAQMRKEIYLDAAEAVQAGVSSVMKLARIDTSYDDAISDYLERAPALAKVDIIANEGVLRAVKAISDGLSEAFIKMATLRLPVEELRRQSELLAEIIASSEEERGRVLALMQQYDPAKDGGRAGFEGLGKRFEHLQQRIAELYEEKGELDKNSFRTQLDVMEAGIEDGQRLSKLAIPAITAVRAELNFQTDEVAFAQIFRESLDRQMGAATDFANRLRGLIEAEEANDRTESS